MKSISVSRQFAPLRVCAEMCLYYYVLAVLTLSVTYNVSTDKSVCGVVSNMVAPRSLQLSILVGACFAVGFVIVRVDRAVLRFLLSLLPGLSFFMGRLEPTVLLLAAAWVYYVICMTVGNFEVYIDVYRRRSRVLFVIALLLTCCLIIYHFGNEAWYGNSLFGGEIFGLLFFVLTVFSLRGMRLSSGAPARMRLIDAAHVVALPALLIVAFFLLHGAVPALTWIFARLTRVLTGLFHLVFPEKELPHIFIPDEDFDKEPPEDPVQMPTPAENGSDVGQISGADPHIRLSGDAWLWIIIVILAAALVYFAIRQIRQRRKSDEKPRLVRERIERVPRERISRRRSGDGALSANVKQIRKAYRSYLDHIRSFDVKVLPSDTSEDVLERSSAYLDIPENAALRRLYIAARYGDPTAATSEQAAEARRCLAAIQSGKRTGENTP